MRCAGCQTPASCRPATVSGERGQNALPGTPKAAPPPKVGTSARLAEGLPRCLAAVRTTLRLTGVVAYAKSCDKQLRAAYLAALKTVLPSETRQLPMRRGAGSSRQRRCVWRRRGARRAAV